jgi:hypothetical protein
VVLLLQQKLERLGRDLSPWGYRLPEAWQWQRVAGLWFSAARYTTTYRTTDPPAARAGTLEPKNGSWDAVGWALLFGRKHLRQSTCHPLGEMRSGWKPSQAGELPGALAGNCRF